jgi:cardiolipin synthase
VDIRIEGPAVAKYQRLFFETWHRQQGETLRGNYFPALEHQGAYRLCVLKARPGKWPNAIHEAYLDAIRRARHHIHILNAYFMPDREITDALRRAAQSGVDVKLVLPGFSDFTIVIPSQHYHYTALLQAGVQIYERQKYMLHAKAAVIDGVWSTVGSYNLDVRSYLHAEEVNAIIFGEEFAMRMEEMFQNDLAHSRRIHLKDWQERPVTHRVQEWLAHRLQYWI